jgi:hypothetical protein
MSRNAKINYAVEWITAFVRRKRKFVKPKPRLRLRDLARLPQIEWPRFSEADLSVTEVDEEVFRQEYQGSWPTPEPVPVRLPRSFFVGGRRAGHESLRRAAEAVERYTLGRVPRSAPGVRGYSANVIWEEASFHA